MVLGKHEIEAALHEEKREINAGRLREDAPLDISEDFRLFCEACRRGDLKVCQEKIQEGANINARDRFDYTPLNLASLCGHFEVVQLLLESGALCERDTFEGERCLYNALNDRIRNLLLSYDYSKSRDPLQPLAGHITSLLRRDVPDTSDITIKTESRVFNLHKFILASRSPFFSKKLSTTPEITSWKVSSSIPAEALEIAILAIYFGEVNRDLSADEADQAILRGVDKLSTQLEVRYVHDAVLESNRRIARQKRTQEIERGRDQLQTWFEKNVLGNSIEIDSKKVDDLHWDRDNSIFADVLLCADHDDSTDERNSANAITDSNGIGLVNPGVREAQSASIPIGPVSDGMPSSLSKNGIISKRSTLFPAHRAMLLRSEYFSAMFSSPFKEAQGGQHLPIIRVDCSPKVLRVILTYIYTETASFGLEDAIEVLFAADLLFIEKLKVKAAMIISTLGNGVASVVEANNPRGETAVEEELDIYEVIRAGWDTRVTRLEEFGARYVANRLECYIDDPGFRDLVRESAGRIQARQETDTVELIDDIRYYLSERFRLRMEDTGFDNIINEHSKQDDDNQAVNDMKGQTSNDPIASNGEGSTLSAAQQFVNDYKEDVPIIRTLDGDIAGDEFSQDALNYQILLGKLDTLLQTLDLDV